MLLTITLTISFLVVINFLLLIFSCNKTTKRTVIKESKPTIIINTNTTNQEVSAQLAPTGS
jgi:cell division protein YceG involved in septum cleavage